MVAIRSFAAVGDTTARALARLDDALDDAPALRADFACVFYDCQHDDEVISAFVRDRFPEAALLGGTSCAGVMSEAGLAGLGSIGLLLVEDPDGDYGSAAVRLEGDAADCAEQALHAATPRRPAAGAATGAAERLPRRGRTPGGAPPARDLQALRNRVIERKHA